MTKSYHINELAITLILLATLKSYYFWCVRSLLFFHQTPQVEMELKERKILEILKNHFGQFHKLNNDNSQLHTTRAVVFQTYVQFHFYYHMNTFLYCKFVILNLSNSYILPSLKYFSFANYDVLASYTISYTELSATSSTLHPENPVCEERYRQLTTQFWR